MAEVAEESLELHDDHALQVARQLAALAHIRVLVEGAEPGALTGKLNRTAGTMGLREAGPLMNGRASDVRRAADLISGLAAILAEVAWSSEESRGATEDGEGMTEVRQPALVG